MNIAIVGAGITGISTALELARDGHRVTVYEQLNAAAEDASFAPGGWLHPSVTPSLSVPGAGMPVASLQKGKDLLHASHFPGSQHWRWLRQWKQREKHATQHHDYHLRDALLLLSDYSRALRWQDCNDPANAAEHQTGALVLLRTEAEAALWQQQLPELAERSVPAQLLPPAQAQQLEPALSTETNWHSALHFPQAESINPRLWTQQLRQQAQNLGVQLHTGAHIDKISTHPTGVAWRGQLHLHDAVVLCTGAHQALLNPLGIQLPSMPVGGYSVTAPVRDPLQAPRAAVMDWAQQATISRLGQRIRITAGLEFAPSGTQHHAPTLQRMYRLLNDWFPGGALLSSPQVQVWRGTRTYLPDGLPAVGHSVQRGIWLNMAHGSHGAALAAGCARLLADQLSDRPTAIAPQAFSPLRFA